MRLPRNARPTQVIRALERLGCEVVRQRGSHAWLRRGERRTVVPVHSGRAIPVGMLAAILKDLEIGLPEFVNEL